MRRNSKKRSPATDKSAAADATFVFRGTIKKPKASNVSQAPISERTAVVTVDEAIDAPPNLSAYTGHDITVELSSKRKVATGEKLIFHATPWLYAENLAVRSLLEEPETRDAPAVRQSSAKKARAQREIREHFDKADLVISGKVVAVRLPKTEGSSAKKAAGGIESTHVSEHDPNWREAIIEVEQVHKGKSSKRQIVVRFPSSTDVAWSRAPKFQAGQQGYFLLHKTDESHRTTSRRKEGEARSATSPSQIYTASHPGDFEPYAEVGGIKSLIASRSVSHTD